MRPLPNDARVLIDCDPGRHLGLRLQRYVDWQGLTPDSCHELKVQEADKQLEFQFSGATAEGFGLSPDAVALAEARAAHWTRRLPVLRDQGSHVMLWHQATSTRLAIGLGANTARETDLTLQRASGLPILPGSALKGLARAVALDRLAEFLGVPALPAEEVAKQQAAQQVTPYQALEALVAAADDERDQAWQALTQSVQAVGDTMPRTLSEAGADLNLFCAIFGRLGQAGAIVWLDAEVAPGQAAEARFEVEVLNPHFPDYYRKPDKPQPPGPWQDPTPVYFLTLAPGTCFAFACLRTARTADLETKLNTELVKTAARWLISGLRERGLGAKTNAGYGRFGKATKA